MNDHDNKEEEEARQHIKLFRIGPKMPENKKSGRRHWTLEDIYLSDICLVVHLEPSDAWNTDSAKEELRTIVRHAAQLSYEHDFLRSVAAVLPRNPSSSPPGWDEVELWAASQDWHRGAFALYVEEAPWMRMVDLLAPAPVPHIDFQRKKPRSAQTILRDVQQLIEKSDTADRYKGVLMSLSDALGRAMVPFQEDSDREDSDRNERSLDPEEELDRWRDRLLAAVIPSVGGDKR